MENHAIQITCGQYESLDKKAMRYIRILRDQYHYVLQTTIPVPRTEPGAVRHRKRQSE